MNFPFLLEFVHTSITFIPYSILQIVDEPLTISPLIKKAACSRRPLFLSLFLFQYRSGQKVFGCKISQHKRSQNNPIPSKHLKIMLFNISHQELNCKNGNCKGNCHSHNQDHKLLTGKIEAKFDDL